MAWKPGEAASSFKIIELRDETDPEFRNRMAWPPSRRFGAAGAPVALDLSPVPSARLETVLARGLKNRPS